MATTDGAAARKEIYMVLGILAGLTTLEFIIAGTKSMYPSLTGLSPQTIATMVLALFIVLTIFKAFYIVAYFMHLRHEVKRLALVILVPLIFVVWLIIGLLIEGVNWGAV